MPRILANARGYSFSCVFLCLSLIQPALQAADFFSSEKQEFRVDILTDQLSNPWGMAFLPDDTILVTEKPGTLRRVSGDGHVGAPIRGLPKVAEKGQGGLLGIALHPQFPVNHWLYLSYSAKGKGGYGTEVIRASLDGDQLNDVVTIFRAEKKTGGGRHFGSRLLFARDGSLYISLGDRGEMAFAQDLNDHRGSLIRLHDDGSVPSDNPFTNSKNTKAEIVSYGHRNIQGLSMDPVSGGIWAHEHGPQGGDELNLIKAGMNYGWPVITYGVNYGIGTKIGEGTHKSGMQQPVYKWVPSIAPSGMAVYSGRRFPAWQGNIFLGSLKFGLLVRLEMEAGRVIREERLLANKFGRIRDVVEGNDGLLYLLTDDTHGKLLRLSPLD